MWMPSNGASFRWDDTRYAVSLTLRSYSRLIRAHSRSRFDWLAGSQADIAEVEEHVRPVPPSNKQKHSYLIISSATVELSATQSGVEVVQDAELSKDDRPLWVAVEAFDLAVFEFEHVATRCVHLLTSGRQFAKGKLERATVGALQGQLHHDDIAIGIHAI